MPFAVQAWETWLSEHLVQAMVNYPEAVMLGNINVIVTTILIVVTIVFFLSLITINIVVFRILFPLLIIFILFSFPHHHSSSLRYRLKHWTSQSHSGSNGERGVHLLYDYTAKDLR